MCSILPKCCCIVKYRRTTYEALGAIFFFMPSNFQKLACLMLYFRAVRVPCFTWWEVPHFSQSSGAKISAFSFDFSPYLAFCADWTTIFNRLPPPRFRHSIYTWMIECELWKTLYHDSPVHHSSVHNCGLVDMVTAITQHCTSQQQLWISFCVGQ